MAEAGKKWELDPAQKVILIPVFFFKVKTSRRKIVFQRTKFAYVDDVT